LKKSGRKGLAHHWIEEVTTGKALGVHRYNRALWFAWCGEYEEALARISHQLSALPTLARNSEGVAKLRTSEKT